MSEILTESFCERCGTRYTFESSAPRRSRVGRVRTFSKGVRNFVLSDESSFSEAMADARGEEEIAATAHQLDAFHRTFNFCLTCRQYTCGDCWNPTDGRCLTCAPLPGMEEAVAIPLDIVALPASNGHVPVEAFEEPAASVDAWPAADLSDDRLARALGTGAVLAAGEDERVAGTDELVAGMDADAGEPGWPEVAALAAVEDEVSAPVEATPVEHVALADQVSDEAVFAAAFEEESAQLVGMEPGQSLEDALAAYEAAYEEDRDAAELPATFEPPAGSFADAGDAELEIVAAAGATDADAADTIDPRLGILAAAGLSAMPGDDEAPPDVIEAIEEPEPVVSWATQAAPEPEAEVAAAEVAEQPEPEIVAAEIAAAAEPQPEILVAPEAEPAPVSTADEAPRVDVIPQPTWPAPAAAPAPEAPVPTPPAVEPAPGPAPWLMVAPEDTPRPSAEPQWPAVPAWRTTETTRHDVPNTLAGRPLLPQQGDASALWAASAREVLGAAPAAVPTAATVATPQPCVQCGLSLSSTARFCRRCGARQG